MVFNSCGVNGPSKAEFFSVGVKQSTQLAVFPMKSPNLRFKLATYPFLSLYFRERMRKNSLHMSLQRETFFEYLNIFFLWSVYAEQKFSKCKLYSHVCHRLAGSFWTKELFLLMLQLCFHGSDLTMDW